MFFLLCAVASVAAETTAEIPANLGVVDLAGFATPVAANRQNVAIEVPGDLGGARQVLNLRARGQGPEYNWTVFTIHNAAPADRKLVMLVEEQRFAGSGILQLKLFGQRPQGVVFSAGQETLERESVQGGDAVAFLIKANATMTFAIEAKATLSNVRIYSQQSFAAREESLAFLRGAVLAIAGLIAFGTLALYGIRAHTAFIAAGFFSLTAMGFMALEGGYLANLALRHTALGFEINTVRAATESLFVLGLAVCMLSFAGLSQRRVPVVLLSIGLLAACLGNLAFAYVEPPRATSIARMGFGVLTALAFVIAYQIRRSANAVVRDAMPFWIALSIWTFYAGVVAIADAPSINQHRGLLAGLAAVLAVMAFTLVRFAFAQGFLAKPLLTDAGRRSLALSGARHFVWDWRPVENRLDISAELASSLGYDPGSMTRAPGPAFLSILHPEDEPSYRNLMDARTLEPGSFQELELRLRDANNAYRWFALRVRALQGPNNQASRCIGTLTDVTRNKVAEDRLISDAVHDPVTGLPSRAIFADRLDREIDKPVALPVHVLFVALERFKTLNDGLGHDVGDQLLLVAGQRISECLSPSETVARLSGSQFAVMHVEAIDGHDVEALAEDIRRAVAQPVLLGEREVYLRASIGISLSSAEGYKAEALQGQAATALHEAQKHGQQTIRLYKHGDDDQREAHVALEAELRRAVDRREIEVLYQPILHLETREIVGLEALARWRHPEKGLLLPDKFIALAEQAGMMSEISSIVLGEAARQMGIWQRTVIRARPVYVAINIPADQMSDTGFVDRLRSVINREGLRPNALKIEITESVAMHHADRARAFIQRLQALGVGVACDDFGTGFSSLASLRDLPFDTLKIDRSFLSPEAIEGRGGIILDSVVALAHNLGMLVVGEGIESDAQVLRLQDMGCDLGQGFHLGEPMMARQVQDLLAVLPVVSPHTAIDQAAEAAPDPGFARLAPRPQTGARDEDIFEAPGMRADRFAPAPRPAPAPLVAQLPLPEELPSIFGARGVLAAELRAAANPPAKSKRRTKRGVRKKRK